MLKYPLTFTNGQSLTYYIRQSKRARYVRMEFKEEVGLLVTQPKGVPTYQVVHWVESKKAWIEKNLKKYLHNAAQKPKPITPQQPSMLPLIAIGETIQICYEKSAAQTIAVEYKENQKTLHLTGAIGNHKKCTAILVQWLKYYADSILRTMLDELSKITQLHYNKLTIRNQKTRWGSCSSKKNINLNVKLLFLPEHWLRYALIHELCHTVEMNHSKAFWLLVEKYEPNYQSIHKAIQQQAIHYIPIWLND